MMLQTHACIKDALKVQLTPTGLNSAKYKKVIDIVSNSTLQLTFKKLLLSKFWCSIIEEYWQLSKKALYICNLYNFTNHCHANEL